MCWPTYSDYIYVCRYTHADAHVHAYTTSAVTSERIDLAPMGHKAGGVQAASAERTPIEQCAVRYAGQHGV